MEQMLAKKMEELTTMELVEVLKKFQMQDDEAFMALKEIIEDI